MRYEVDLYKRFGDARLHLCHASISVVLCFFGNLLPGCFTHGGHGVCLLEKKQDWPTSQDRRRCIAVMQQGGEDAIVVA